MVIVISSVILVTVVGVILNFLKYENRLVILDRVQKNGYFIDSEIKSGMLNTGRGMVDCGVGMGNTGIGMSVEYTDLMSNSNNIFFCSDKKIASASASGEAFYLSDNNIIIGCGSSFVSCNGGNVEFNYVVGETSVGISFPFTTKVTLRN